MTNIKRMKMRKDRIYLKKNYWQSALKTKSNVLIFSALFPSILIVSQNVLNHNIFFFPSSFLSDVTTGLFEINYVSLFRN